ncbi:MAG: Hsp20/alpha crystallin family protein [Planctomyces sp.]|nr:Hsp20/alpha crystallin family protein [Planctomyces sp.]
MATKSLPQPQAATPSVRVSDPFSVIRQEMNELFSNLWGASSNANVPASFAPALDVAEKDNCFELHMDIPGLETKDIDIQVQGNTVTVTGSRKEEKEEKGKTFHRIERSTGSFSRTVTLPCNVMEKEVAAEYTNGVLLVVLPKSQDARPRKIAIRG